MLFEQRKCTRLVALRECAVADHVREHNRRELAMFSAGFRHCSESLCRSLPERTLKAKASPDQSSYASSDGAQPARRRNSPTN